jgi:class 3 adenylate cyclase
LRYEPANHLDLAGRPGLLILDGPHAGKQVGVEEELVVGRGEDAGLDIGDHEVSRRHARFRSTGDLLEVADLGSLNGTWVNGRQITDTTALKSDDVVKLGSTRLQVVQRKADRTRASDAPAAPPQAEEPEATVPAREPEVSEPAAEAGPVARGLLGRTHEDELRPVTSLFADIVGSTSIGEQLPPDDVRVLVGECVTRMSRIIEQHGGVVDAYMGDGIAAFFGVPVAREDDVERAARAALGILETIGRFAEDVRRNWSLPDFNIRVGMNTGQVAVGMVGAANPHAVALGDTTNVAARLQSTAEPGTVVVGGRTARELRDRFLLEPLGEISVKGRSATVEAWRLVGAGDVPGATEVRSFVDRERETRRLAAALEELVAGNGRVVVIVGEPGIGKTRLLERFRESANGNATWLEGSCVSSVGELSSSPFAEILRSWLAADPTADSAHSLLRAKLEQLVGSRATEVLPFLASFLSIGDESDAGLRELSAERRSDGIRNAYCTWARALCGTGPLIFAVEDFQWAERPTRELADSLLEVIDSSPLLLTTTFRIEPQSEGWRFRGHAVTDYAHRTMELRLAGLEAHDASELLDRLAPGGLEDPVRQQLIQRADGNPLYLEQMLRLYQETGELEEKRSRTWAMTVVQHELPSPLESLLIARIDALPSAARRFVQFAAIVGRSFSPRLVAGTVGVEAVSETIEILLRQEIIRERRSVSELEYEFTHGLLREAALSPLPRSRRRDMYRGVAAAIERIYSDSLDAHLEQLAYYNARAGDPSRALWYLVHAARRATAVKAYEQATELWQRAAELAEQTEDVDAQRQIARELWQLREPQA